MVRSRRVRRFERFPAWAWFALPAAAMVSVASVGTTLAGHPSRPDSHALPRSTVAIVTSTEQRLDPRFDTCKLARGSGYGPYSRGVDPEYGWYPDVDGDGVVCD